MGYRMKTVARETGLSPLLIRAWERRYGLVAPRRGPNGFREYSAMDVRVLRAARALVDAGRPISEVSALPRPRLIEEGEALGSGGVAGARPTSAIELETAVAAVRASDPAALQASLGRAFAFLTQDRAVEELLLPLCRRVGEEWERGAISPAQEHLASELVRHRVRSLVEGAAPLPGTSRGEAVLACLPGERHDLALVFVAYRLVRRGFVPTILGADLPLKDLVALARARTPALVGLSVTIDETYRAAARSLARLRSQIPAPVRLVAGGHATVRFAEQLREWGFELDPPEAAPV